MNALLQDLRYGIRTLLKDRAFTAVAVLTLAVALGANSAIFSVVDAVLLRPLPFPNSDAIIAISSRSALTGQTTTVLSYPNFADLKAQTKTFAAAGLMLPTASFVWESGEAERVSGALMTADMFRVLGTKPELGRTFGPSDDRNGAPSTIVISHSLWKRAFNGDPAIVGRRARFGSAQKVFQIIGVMPESFTFPFGSERADYWTPFFVSMKPDQLTQRGNVSLYGLARLRDGVSLRAAEADAELISRRIEAANPQEATGLRFVLQPLQSLLVSDIRRALYLLLGAVAVVLLIGCANVANLLLARAAARRREISIRAAVGATRGRIVRQLLVESVLLALLAGVLGVLLAAWGIDVLKAIAPSDIARIDTVSLDLSVLGFTLGLSVLTGIIFGLAPALSASKADLNEALKEGTRGSTEGRGRNRVRNLLVTATIALSLVLLVGAGLLLRSFIEVTGVNPGFDYRDAVVVDLSVRAGITGPDAIGAATHRLVDALRAVPGVQAVSATDTLPLGGNESTETFRLIGKPPFAVGREPAVTNSIVLPGFFSTMRIPLRRGREFTDRDAKNAPKVLIVNDEFARRFYPGEEALGRRVSIDGEPAGSEREIVGVVANIRFRDLAAAAGPMFYVPYDQRPVRYMSYVVRGNNAAALIPALRMALRRADPNQPLLYVRTLADIRHDTLARRQAILVLLGMLSALALILAAVGIYSLMSYTVTQRTSEIGIRMALGADVGDVLRLVVGNAMRLIVIGITTGVVVALIATRVMGSLLYGVGASDPVTFVAICALLSGVALLASWLPARRAARVDPLVAIRAN
jgi:putative ABC transport system permease protein